MRAKHRVALMLLLSCAASSPASAQQANFCADFPVGSSGGKILFADFNGDSLTDVLCHYPRGKKEVSFAKANGTYRRVSTESTWCGHAGSDVLAGNFDGDKYADLMCTDTSGKKWIEYGKPQGAFTWNDEDWAHEGRFCSHAGATLHLGYFNADKKTDLLCHDRAGKVWIAYAKSKPTQFFVNRQDYTEDWKNESEKFCSHEGAVFSVSDANNDGRDDLVCRDTAGKMWVQYADENGQFFTAGSSRYERPAYDESCQNTCHVQAMACLAATIGKAFDVVSFLTVFLKGGSIAGQCDGELNACLNRCPAYPAGNGPPPGRRVSSPVKKMH